MTQPFRSRLPSAVEAGLAGIQRLAATNFAPSSTIEGRAWTASLASLVRKTADAWQLAVRTGDIRNGYNAVVLPVERAGRPLSLKLVWPVNRARAEAEALAAWRGHGVVELVLADFLAGVLLLERLDADEPLSRLPLPEAADIAGGLIRTLALSPPPALPASPGHRAVPAIPTTQDEAAQLRSSLPQRQRALGQPVPATWVALAASLATTLSANPAALLVHADLHYGNVLRSYRAGEPWIAIDPKAAIGDPERSVPELLWTRADELDDSGAVIALLDRIVRSGGLDRDKAAAWALLRTVDYWLWGLRHGLTEDPVRCERIAGALVASCGGPSRAR